jgi:flagellar biosynthesis protein FlhB
MADDAKRFPATELKLERLRSDGIVVQSREVLLFAAVVGVGIGISTLITLWHPDFIGYAKSSFSDPSSDTAGLSKLFEQAKYFLAFGVLLFCGLVSLAVFVLGLLQTRFLVVFKQLVPDFGRILPSLPFAPIAGMKRVIRSTILLAVVLVFFIWYLKQLFLDYNQEVVRTLSALDLDAGYSRAAIVQALQAPLDFLRSWAHFFFMCMSFMLFFLAIGCYLLDYFSFRRAQRMTRSELEEEYREMETPGDFDSSRRELLDES